jgi:WD40 repeat protein
MIFELVQDFADALDAMPEAHSHRCVLRLLDEAIRRDVHFVDRHPTTLFQCLWNLCWWYDCPDAAKHYDVSRRTGTDPLPWEWPERPLATLLEQWREIKEWTQPGFFWLRSLRAPFLRLGAGQRILLSGHSEAVVAACFSPDGDLLATAGDTTVRLWNLRTGAEVRRLEGGFGWLGVCFSPQASQLASASFEGPMIVWDVSSGAELLELKGHRAWVSCVRYSPDGRHLASASMDGTIRVWDAVSGAELRKFSGLSQLPLNSVDFSPDGRRIAGACFQEQVFVWDASTGTELLRFAGTTERVLSVCFSPDGRRLAGAEGRGAIIRDAANGEIQVRLEGHTDLVSSVCFSPDGRHLATASNDKTVRVWDVRTGVEIHQFKGHRDHVNNVSFSPNGRRIASTANDRTIRVWEPSSQTEAIPYRMVSYRELSEDLQRIAEQFDHTLLVRDTISGIDLIQIPQVSHVRKAAFSPDHRRLAVLAVDSPLRVWDLTNGNELATLNGDVSKVSELFFAPDGRRLATGEFVSEDSRDSTSGVTTKFFTVRVWDAISGAELIQFDEQQWDQWKMSFSSDGQWFAGACRDNTVALGWLAGDSKVVQLHGHTKGITRIGFSPDSQWRFTGSLWDKTTRVWDPARGECLEILEFRYNLEGAVQAKLAPFISVHIRGDAAILDNETSRCVVFIPGVDERTWAKSCQNGSIWSCPNLLAILEGIPR